MSSDAAYAETLPAAAAGTQTEARTLDTLELIKLCQQGDRTAFAQLYRSHVDGVYRYLAYRLRDNHTAEDLTAEVFVRVLRKIGDFEWRGIDFNAWLLRIARNILLDYLKSSGTRLEVVGIADEDRSEDAASLPGSDLEALDRLDREELYQALNKLRPEQQEVLYLRFLQGLSSAEVAQAMGKSEGAVRVLQFRALKHLLKAMQDEGKIRR